MRPLFISVCILAAGCAEIKVLTDYDRRVDFSQYKTWCWMNGCTPSYEGPSYMYDSATITTIANAIAVEMQNKGFIQGDENADLLLDFHIILKEDSSMSAWVHEEDLPFRDPYNEPDDYYYFLRGSLIIHIADRRQGRMIWRGDARQLMALTPEISDADIERGVRKTLKKFPPEKESE